MIIKDMFINFCIISTFLFFGNIVFRNWRSNPRISPFVLSCLTGAFLGLFGIIQMHFTFKLDNGTLLDLRQIPIIVATVLGGGISGTITTLIISIARLWLSAPISIVSFLGIANACMTLLITYLVFRTRQSFSRKWVITSLISTLNSLFFFLIWSGFTKETTLILFILILFSSFIFTYLLIERLRRYNQLYDAMSQEVQLDFLTGLYNYRGFEMKYNQLSQEKHIPFALFLLDIDHFKMINDQYGHSAGDAVLVQFAEVLRRSVRVCDHCSRKGGEEFSLILEHVEQQAEAIEWAENIRKNIEKHTFVIPDGRQVSLTVSIGIGFYPLHPCDELLDKTDDALYQAKKAGRNQFCIAL
ncbi:diguanylate cyclase [Paenibacillus sp. PK4536]|uniref:Diguanylate cyclase n=1 Tax=Paenibacillus nuruki TaxID=1886670 RepID=A0A1E3KYB6_9BACL|nr:MULTISPECIES: diguanylate cyclase [Paenibacillus]ODP26464.1 Diguanylate cyclase [Paenibacillus nuruki]WIM40672.1 diguanylate cyclase [Paenibacillus sp. PK4536]CAJ1316979.1 Diguanylate cyclase [Paenibacillus nuruki]